MKPRLSGRGGVVHFIGKDCSEEFIIDWSTHHITFPPVTFYCKIM